MSPADNPHSVPSARVCKILLPPCESFDLDGLCDQGGGNFPVLQITIIMGFQKVRDEDYTKSSLAFLNGNLQAATSATS